MCRRVFARVSILSASGPYLDRPADFPRPQPPVTQTIIVTPLYGIFEFVSLFSVRFRGASRRKGRFFRAHCTRSNTTTTTITTRARERRIRVDEFVPLYGYISFSSTRAKPLLRPPIATCRYIAFARYCVYTYIYISPNSRFCYLFEAWLDLYRAGKVRRMGARRIGGNDSSERGEYDRCARHETRVR